MSVCGQSGQAEEDSANEEGAPAAPSATRDIYKQKPASKVVRVLTVLAYLLSVSLAAILLSVYYVCVWRSPEFALGNSTQLQEYQRQQQLYRPEQFTHDKNASTLFGGGNTTVNGDVVHSTPENITGTFNEDSVTEPSSDATNATLLDADIPSELNASLQFNNETDSGT